VRALDDGAGESIVDLIDQRPKLVTLRRRRLAV